ncbi:universal stress protein [Labrys wisconsinensis]|uniref:Nucleotide-binding universal stress UspA family protein n=1 Tax=Labrys wisconsinensis TaxID=425677 RepID=A0ABU0IZL5_9HYPH|nr:universal stress protein [Labrys wisconsinensis]MDQ0467448.1 nucleotide-binding universal stress UspA family protein [Labrys wisconsinensis]
MLAAKRTAYEPGHRPKYLVIVDETPESDRALYYAARRCARIGAGVVLAIITVPEAVEDWLGVGALMRAEAEEKAQEVLVRAAARARAVAGVEPECVVRAGQKADEIVALINEDTDIAVLVLAAGTGKEGPGPLVSTLVGKMSGSFPIPIAVIPGRLTDEHIDTLA